MKSINSAQAKEIGKSPVLGARGINPVAGIMVLSEGSAHCSVATPMLPGVDILSSFLSSY